MNNFADIEVGSKLFSIDSNYQIKEIEITEITSRKAFENEYGRDVYCKFFDDQKTIYKFLLENKDNNEFVKLCKVWNYQKGEYKNKENPYYLISVDKAKMIEYYVQQLKKSIETQQKIINDTNQKINELNGIITVYSDFLKKLKK